MQASGNQHVHDQKDNQPGANPPDEMSLSASAGASRTTFLEASAPGKVILTGDHAVVHGKPAILAAIDLRCRARLIPRSDSQIEIVSTQVAETSLVAPDLIVEKTTMARAKWEEFHRTNSRELLRQITPHDLDLVEIGVGEMLLATQAHLDQGFSLLIDSQLPVGAGLGSSATVVAAVVKVLDSFLGTRLSKAQLSNIVYEAEKKKHGASSGVDVAAAVYGSLLWYRRETDFLRVASPLDFIDARILNNITLVMTGRPDASTGEAVRFVMEKYRQSPGEIQAIFDQIEAITRELVTCLRSQDRPGVLKCINRCGDQLDRLGVVPPSARSIIDEVRKAGGAAKITGAGSLGGEHAGTILAFHDHPEILHEILSKRDLPHRTVRISATGAE